jgi:hypothetical protein
MFSQVRFITGDLADARSSNLSSYLPLLACSNVSTLTDELSIGQSLVMARLQPSQVRTTVRTTSWIRPSEKSLLSLSTQTVSQTLRLLMGSKLGLNLPGYVKVGDPTLACWSTATSSERTYTVDAGSTVTTYWAHGLEHVEHWPVGHGGE